MNWKGLNEEIVGNKEFIVNVWVNMKMIFILSIIIKY